jgi:hypothetical protein
VDVLTVTEVGRAGLRACAGAATNLSVGVCASSRHSMLKEAQRQVCAKGIGAEDDFDGY